MLGTRNGSFLAALLVLAGCGGAAEAPAPAPAEPTTGGEQAQAPRPTGPPASYVAEDHQVVVRLDMEAVRSSAVSADIASLVRSYPTWRDLLGSSGIDPVRDFDRVLLAAPAVVSDRSIIVIRHHLGGARVREAVLQMASQRGSRPEWRDAEGFPVVEWPAETAVPRLVVLTADQELVVTTADDLDRVIEVARDHAARREGDGVIEPALQLEDGLIATIVADAMGESTGRMRLRHPPEAFQVIVRQDGAQEGRIVLAAQGRYATDGAAEEARRYFVEQRDFYAGQMLVRAVGLDRVLREAQIGASGSNVDVSASLTEEEIQRVLGLFALGQIGGS
jgi:hypothetical protein